jgi:hypothetical protein
MEEQKKGSDKKQIHKGASAHLRNGQKEGESVALNTIHSLITDSVHSNSQMGKGPNEAFYVYVSMFFFPQPNSECETPNISPMF